MRLDPTSTWHITALFAAALESTTLCTRLKTSDRVYSSNLGNIADLLNVFGKQTIANLEMSIFEPQKSQQNGNGTNGVNGSADAMNGRDERMRNLYGASIDHDADSESGSQKGTATLDIDLSSPQDLNLNQDYRRRRRRRIFSQILADRGPESLEPANRDDELEMRDMYGMRRRSKVHK